MPDRLLPYAPTTIRARVALGAALLWLLVVGLVTVVLLDSMRTDFARVLAAQQDSLVEHVADELDAKLAQNLDVLRRSAELVPTDALGSPERLRGLYEHDAALLALFDDVLVIDATGRVVADVPALPGRAGINAADRGFFQRVMRTGEAIVSEPLLSLHRQEPIINMAAPMRDAAGNVAAVLTGVLRLGKPNVLGRLASERIGRSGYFSLLTKGDDPVYIVHPDARRILQPWSTFGSTAATTAALRGTAVTTEDRNGQGVRALFSYRTLRTANWLLVAVLPSEEAFAPIDRAERKLALFAAMLGLLVAAVVWLMVDRLLAPLTRLRDHIKRLRGTLGPALPAPVERADEIGDLAIAFNELMDDRRRSTESLERQARDLRLASKVFENTADAVIVSDADDRVMMVNPAFTRLTGYAEREMVGKLLADSPFRPIDPIQSAERMAVQRQQGFVTAEVLRYRKDGTELPLWITASNVTDEHGRITNFVRVFTDISHLKESQRRLETLASSDPLTGLHNRRAFDERLQQALERRHAGGAGFALLFVDLDTFKSVNDAFGHDHGDQLLKILGRRLQSCVRTEDMLCRFGGDEFAIILEGEGAAADAARVARRVLAACAQPFGVGEDVLRISASIGIAVCPDHGDDVPTLLKSADAAMYAAKRSGGNCSMTCDAPAVTC